MSVRRAVTMAALVLVAFLALCFYWPRPVPRYTFFPEDRQWYRLDDRGIER